MTNCFKCNEPIEGPHFKRAKGPECRSCHIIKVFGSLQVFGKIAGLGIKYEHSKEYIQTWRGF